jgi:hypothetical protein
MRDRGILYWFSLLGGFALAIVGMLVTLFGVLTTQSDFPGDHRLWLCMPLGIMIFMAGALLDSYAYRIDSWNDLVQHTKYEPDAEVE